MHDLRIIALNKVRFVTTPSVQRPQICVAGSSLSSRAGNLVAVEVQNRQDRTVPDGIKKVDRLPASLERAGLGFAVTYYAGNNQIGIVECRAERMNQRLAKFAALVHRVRDVRPAVAWHSARRRELPEHESEPVLIVRNLRVHFCVRAFQV